MKATYPCCLIALLFALACQARAEVTEDLKRQAIRDIPGYVIEIDHERVFNSHIPVYGAKIIKAYRQPSADWFVEGLQYDKGLLLESMGKKGRSGIVKWDPDSGKVLAKLDLPENYFGEDITIFHNKLYQLSYQENKAFVFDPTTFRKLGEFPYPGEGWGITHDGRALIKSNGTDTISYITTSGQQIRSINVHDATGPVRMINAMDYINGRIFANIYLTPYIAIIAPETGQVTAWLSLEGLNQEEYDLVKHYVPNGITHHNHLLYVTGKNWSKLFLIKVVRLK